MARLQRMRGRVRGMAHGGEAAVETDAGVVLVRGGLPGEQLEIEADDKRGGVRRGRVLHLIGDASPDRQQPACAITARCGGCPWMAWKLEPQRAHKRDLVARAVGELWAPGASAEVELVAGSDDLGYRRRARLAWARQGKRVAIGYRAGGGREVVAVDRCAVLDTALQRTLDALHAALGSALAGHGEIELTPGNHDTTCVSLSTDAAQPPEAYAACATLAQAAGVSGVALRAGGIGAAATWGTLEQAVTGLDGLPLIGPADGFSQANAAINRELVRRVQVWAEPEGADILELYAGTGNLTVALAPQAKQVWAVEMDAALVKACQANLAARGLGNVKVRVDPAEVGAKGAAVDCVVLDPPRTGAKDAIESIVARKPKRIVYVSCDPVTLRRDAQLLGAAGYRVDRAAALDMFPHTAHVEAVVRFVRV